MSMLWLSKMVKWSWFNVPWHINGNINNSFSVSFNNVEQKGTMHHNKCNDALSLWDIKDEMVMLDD